jgi:capsular exopolysaccharide synthesis family protein
MSRIHEALKKAEQERAAIQGGTSQPGMAGAPVMDASVYPQAPGEASRNSAVGADFTASTFSPEAMLARCPQLEWKPDLSTMLFMNGTDGTQGTEEYRTLRSRLYHIREKMTLKTVLVTSALPQEGKSFTASNLAQVLVRQHGRRVLLIDGDLRGPRLHLMLGTSASPGLSDYLQGRNDEFSILQRGPIENLYFIPSGAGIENPAELVGNERLKVLIQRLETLFDWIIVDSPPAVPLSDASLLAKACDGVLMVVRSNSTPSDVARKARMEFPEESLIGVVLNGINRESVPYARYYYEAYQKNGSATKT